MFRGTHADEMWMIKNLVLIWTLGRSKIFGTYASRRNNVLVILS